MNPEDEEESATEMLVTACDQLMAGSEQHIADLPDSGVPPFSSFFTQNIDIPLTVDHSSAVFRNPPVNGIPRESKFFQARKENERLTHDNFLAALLDTGAQKSVIEKSQAISYCKLNNVLFSPSTSTLNSSLACTYRVQLERFPL